MSEEGGISGSYKISKEAALRLKDKVVVITGTRRGSGKSPFYPPRIT